MLANNQQPDSDLVIFCEVIRRDPFFLVGRAPRPDWRLADLLHVQVATVSEVPTPVMSSTTCVWQGSIRQVRRIPDRSMPENLAALRAGDIEDDAGLPAFVEQAVEDGVGHIWWLPLPVGLRHIPPLHDAAISGT